MRSLVLISLVGLMSFTACNRKQVVNPRNMTNTTETTDDLVVDLSLPENEQEFLVMSRSGCYGECPIYSITVYNNGKIEFIGTKFTDKIGSFQGELNDQQLSQLVYQVIASDFMQMQPVFPSEEIHRVADFPTTTITVNYKDQLRTVKNHNSIDSDNQEEKSAYDRFIALERLVDALSESLEFVEIRQ